MAEEIGVTETEEVDQETAPHYRDKNYAAVYSNFAQVGLTPWDIRITFSQLGEHEIGVTGVSDLTTVIMTPLMAKVLVQVLRQNVLLYEKNHCAIPVPAGLLRRTESPSASPSESPSASPSPEPPEEREPLVNPKTTQK